MPFKFFEIDIGDRTAIDRQIGRYFRKQTRLSGTSSTEDDVMTFILRSTESAGSGFDKVLDTLFRGAR